MSINSGINGASGALSPGEFQARKTSSSGLSQNDFGDIFKLVSDAVDKVGKDKLGESAKDHIESQPDNNKGNYRPWNLFQ